MAVYTRYAKVLDAEGKPLSVREALALINQTLDEALAEQEGDFDADSRWAVTWFEQSGSTRANLALPICLPVQRTPLSLGSWRRESLHPAAARCALLKPDELPAGWDPTTDPRLTAWEIVHHLIRALESGGEGAAAALVAKLGAKAEIARELAYRLYTVCERKKRAAEALSYNGLVQSWPEITRLAREGGIAQARAGPTVRAGVSRWRSPITNVSARRWSCLRAGSGRSSSANSRASYKDRAAAEASRFMGEDRLNAKRPSRIGTSLALLKLMWDSWNDVFRKTLGPAERSLVSELRDHRNKWAHQQPFSSDDAYRALDSAGRLLTAVSAPQADEIEKMKMELLRLRFDEQVRSEKRKSAGTAIESQGAGNLKPWREVVTPHKDVASGRYQQAEFAADLWQVHLGEGTDEYREPGRILPPHLSHREPEAPAGRRRAADHRAAAAIRSSSCRPTSAAARRTRCWRSITCFPARRPASSPGSTL